MTNQTEKPNADDLIADLASMYKLNESQADQHFKSVHAPSVTYEYLPAQKPSTPGEKFLFVWNDPKPAYRSFKGDK